MNDTLAKLSVYQQGMKGRLPSPMRSVMPEKINSLIKVGP